MMNLRGATARGVCFMRTGGSGSSRRPTQAVGGPLAVNINNASRGVSSAGQAVGGALAGNLNLSTSRRGVSSAGSGSDSPEIAKVGVLGLGLMGHGIVQATAMAPGASYQVVGLESNKEAMEAARKKIQAAISKQLSKGVAKGKLSERDADAQREDALARMTFTTDKQELADCDLIIEAITENPKVRA